MKSCSSAFRFLYQLSSAKRANFGAVRRRPPGPASRRGRGEQQAPQSVSPT